jgi:hypothetical protein
VQVVLSGFKGTEYPDEIAAQRSLFTPLIEPIVVLILGKDVPFDLVPRRGMVRNGVLPPCEATQGTLFGLCPVMSSLSATYSVVTLRYHPMFGIPNLLVINPIMVAQ